MTDAKACVILFFTVKKATITSKCGKKVEVYYFSEHPANKITGTASADKIEIEGEDIKIVNEKMPNKIEAPSPADSLQFFLKKFKNTPHAETFLLDDSLKSDVVPTEELTEGELYKIKGLNLIARYEGGALRRRFNFHGTIFWVEESSILKAREFEKNNYIDKESK